MIRRAFALRMPGAALLLWSLAVPAIFGQAPAMMGMRGPAIGAASPGLAGGAGRFGYGGGSFPYPGMIIPYVGGYNYGYGGYDPMVASVPSAAYFTYGNTSYTTESPSPIPAYVPRPAFAALPPPLPLTALLKVQVPLNAEVWLEGQQMRSVGAMRHYRSPPLNPAREYAYEVRARWQVDGKPIEEIRHVAIRAGATVIVDFTHLDPLVPRPSAPAPTPPPTPASTPANAGSSGT